MSFKESSLRIINSIPFPEVYRAAFFVFLPLSVFAPKGITVLTCLTAIVFLMDMTRNFALKHIFQENNTLVFLLSIILIFSFFTCFGSVAKGESFKNWIRIFSLFLIGYVILRGIQTTSYQKEIIKGLLTGFMVAFILLFIEAMTKGLILSIIKDKEIKLFKYNQSLCMMIFLAGPVFCLYEKYFAPSNIFHFLSGSVFVVLIYVIFSLNHDASKVAVVVGLILCVILYFLLWKFKKIFLRMIVCFCFIGSLIIPKIYSVPSIKEFTFQHIKKVSLYHRIAIWDVVGQTAFNQRKDVKGSLKRTLFGFGIEGIKGNGFSNLDYVFEVPFLKPELSSESLKTEDNFSWVIPLEKDKNSKTYNHLIHYDFPFFKCKGIPLHPHNIVLHVLLDLGIIGLFFLFFLFEVCIRGLLRLSSCPFYTCVAFGTLINFLIIASTSYGIWQSWWICGTWMVASLLQLLKVKPEKLQEEQMSISFENDLKQDFIF